jgi:hypothetical protein
MLFEEVKNSLPVSGDDYDAQIIREIKACAIDLTSSAEIVLPGEISITRTNGEGDDWTIIDNSTITDDFVIGVICTWCNMRIGNPPNYEQLRQAYKSMKGQMRLSSKYTNYGGTTAEEATTE